MNATHNQDALITQVYSALHDVLDPEFGISVVDLGLLLDVGIDRGTAMVDMTLTSMHCPAGQIIVDGVRAAARSVPGVDAVEVRLVWDPPWTPDRLTVAARRKLGWTKDSTLF